MPSFCFVVVLPDFCSFTKLIPSVYSAVSYGEGIAVSDSDEDNQAGVVTLLHNIIIAGDEQTRAWFAQYLKCMQQKVHVRTVLYVHRFIIWINSFLWIYHRLFATS